MGRRETVDGVAERLKAGRSARRLYSPVRIVTSPHSRTYEPGSYFELSVSPWGHVRCTCPGFTYRGVCKHAEALTRRLNDGHT